MIVNYTPRGRAALEVARARMDALEREFAAQVGDRRWVTVRRALEELFGA